MQTYFTAFFIIDFILLIYFTLDGKHHDKSWPSFIQTQKYDSTNPLNTFAKMGYWFIKQIIILKQ